MMIAIIAVIAAFSFCVTILYVDGKVIDAQSDYLTAIHECLEDQAKEIKALWLMSDYFHHRLEGGANEEHSRAGKPPLCGGVRALQEGRIYAEGADVRADQCADRGTAKHGQLDEARREDLDEGV
jgi:hypothetical protein